MNTLHHEGCYEKIRVCLSRVLFISQAGFALLPPLYQTANEIKAILSDQQLGQKLQSGDVIMSIQKNKESYEVVTNTRKIQVDVIYQPANRPGPAQFVFKFYDPIPN